MKEVAGHSIKELEARLKVAEKAKLKAWADNDKLIKNGERFRCSEEVWNESLRRIDMTTQAFFAAYDALRRAVTMAKRGTPEKEEAERQLELAGQLAEDVVAVVIDTMPVSSLDWNVGGDGVAARVTFALVHTNAFVHEHDSGPVPFCDDCRPA